MVEGVIFDIEIHASDPAVGVQRVELYVDEQLQQTSESEAEGSVSGLSRYYELVRQRARLAQVCRDRLSRR